MYVTKDRNYIILSNKQYDNKVLTNNLFKNERMKVNESTFKPGSHL